MNLLSTKVSHINKNGGTTISSTVYPADSGLLANEATREALLAQWFVADTQYGEQEYLYLLGLWNPLRSAWGGLLPTLGPSLYRDALQLKLKL